MRLLLCRDELGSTHTLGVVVGTSLVLQTIEQPWNRNIPFQSCVPFGEYRLVPIRSPSRGETWVLVNPDLNVYASIDDALDDGKQVASGPEDAEEGMARFMCLIHPANEASELQGCIAPGMTRGPGARVNLSRDACSRLRSVLGHDEEHTLVIERGTHQGTAG